MSPRDATESDRNGDHEIRPFQSQKSCLEHDYPFVNRVVGKRGVRLYLSQSVRLGQKDFAGVPLHAIDTSYNTATGLASFWSRVLAFILIPTHDGHSELSFADTLAYLSRRCYGFSGITLCFTTYLLSFKSREHDHQQRHCSIDWLWMRGLLFRYVHKHSLAGPPDQ